MKYLIQTTKRNTFSKEGVERLKTELKSFTLFTETVRNNFDYYVFVNITTTKELDVFVRECKHNIVYGNIWKSNGEYQPVIEIYNDCRE